MRVLIQQVPAGQGRSQLVLVGSFRLGQLQAHLLEDAALAVALLAGVALGLDSGARTRDLDRGCGLLCNLHTY